VSDKVSVYEPSPIKHQRRSRVERAALDRLLLQRFQGKVGRGLAIQLARRRGASTQAESLLYLPPSSLATLGKMNPAPERGIMARCKH